VQYEHTALNVADPVAAADWYVQHLQMRIVRKGDPPISARFLADSTGRVILEIYHNPLAPEPDHPRTHPLTLHVAFAVDDIEGQRDRLLRAGATLQDEIEVTAAGDRVVMLRDPWGLPLQLVQRVKPLA